MNFIETFWQSFDSLKTNKLRSFLTMLGIVMGVFSIITIMAISNAAEAYVNEQFEKIGANTITITYEDRNVSENYWLTLNDLELVKNAAPEIKNIATMIQKSGSIRVDQETKNAQVLGVSSQYKNFDLIEITHGRFINDFDVTSRSRVVVVDESFAQKYFRRKDIVGEYVSLRTSRGMTINLKVVGVKAAGDDLFGAIMNHDMFPAIIYMPITTVQSIYNSNQKLETINVTVQDKDRIKQIGDRIIFVLERMKGKNDLYIVYNSVDMQKAISDILRVVSAVLLVVAVITLVVGGIGIINILLVSVTERIREIGIRKALGAQKKDIILQFISESVIMTGISGLIGIFIGVGAGTIISRLIKIPPVVDFKTVILAFSGSVLLGLIFGVYPAKRAADLDPVESLRHE